MGLFTNNKKPCPICGEGTPRLLATQIAGNTPLCDDCSRKVSMVSSQVSKLSVEGLKEHLLKREENANYLKTVFAPTKRIEVGWTHINIDEVNRTFTIPLNICGDTKNPPVFKFEELQGYEILEEYTPIERFNRGDVSPLCTPMMYNPVIQFGFDDKDDKAELINRSFTLNLYLTNPCWDKVESSAGSASGHERDFHRDYINHLNTLRPVSAALVGIIGSNVSGNVAQSNVGSISDDLIKFKELLDAGIINQDEFDIKKKQLLGL